MSNYLIKGETLTNIADAIREKTGKTDAIAVTDMATEIGDISATIEVTELPTENINTNAVYSMNGKLYRYEEQTVSTTVAPNDLTGYTVTVPSGWTATAGYGHFYVDYDEPTFGEFYSLWIGYGYDDTGVGFPPIELRANAVGLGDSTAIWTTNDSDLQMTITGGDDATNAELIQWFTSNNATFSKSEYAWVEYAKGSGSSGGYAVALFATNSYSNNAVSYSIDSGATWTTFTNNMVIISGVSKIRFKFVATSSSYPFFEVGTKYDSSSIGGATSPVFSAYESGESSDITITKDTIYYLKVFYATGGGSN